MSQNRSARRYVHRTADERAALVAEWERGGQSAHGFEQQRGLAKGSLWRWKRDAKVAVVSARPAITFAPVHIRKPQASPVFDAEHVIAEVVLGREVRVRVLAGADMSQVSSLVRALSGGPAC